MNDALGPLVWGDARFLWLLPLALLPFLRRRPRARTVASTAPWRGIRAGRGRSLDFARALAIAALFTAAAEPRLLPAPDGDAPVAVRSVGRAAVLDVLPPSPGEIRVRTGSGEPILAWTADGPDARRLPDALRGRRITVVLPDGSTHALDIPEAPPLPRVSDASESPAVARALDALARTGLVARTDDPSTADVRIENADVPPAADLPAAGRIVFPATDPSRATRVLPAPTGSAATWLAGLAPSRWTILSAVELAPGPTPVLSDDRGEALIAVTEDTVHFAFRPEESDLPDRAEWPVLLGRAIERSAPTPLAPGGATPARPLPTVLLVLLALGLVPWGAETIRARAVLGVLCLAALLVPPLPVLTPRAVSLGDGTTGPALVRAATRARGGGAVEVPADRAIPADRRTIAEELAARNVGVTVLPSVRSAFTVQPRRVALGESVTITGADGGTIEVTRPDGSTVDGGVPADATAEHRSHAPDVPGLWSYRAGDRRVSVAVDAPIEVVVIDDDVGPTGAGAALARSSAFRIVPGTDPPGLPPLPDPPENGLVLWDAAAPGDRSADDVARLAAWLGDGGTLLAVAAPPFRGREGASPLDPLLPAPLPAPPRPPRRDHGVLLLDLSGSVAGEPLRSLWAGVSVLLSGTPEGDRFAVAGFRSDTRWIVPPGRPIDADALENVQGSIAAGGGTRLDLALDFAAAAIAARDDLSPTIVLVTDGRASGADWSAIGARLADAGIALCTVALGSDPDTAVLSALHDAADGTWTAAPDAATAARLLAAAIAPPRGPWRPVEAPLRALGVAGGGTGGIAGAWPEGLGGVLRRLEDPTAPLTGEAVLVDATGAVLLARRRIDRGRALLLRTGLDAESLAPGRAGTRFVEALLGGIAREVRGAPTATRAAHVRLDTDGALAMSVERGPEDRPGGWTALDRAGRATAVAVRARDDEWRVVDPDRLPDPCVLRGPDGVRTAPIDRVAASGTEAWNAFARRLPTVPDAADLHLSRLLLALAALGLASGPAPLLRRPRDGEPTATS